MARREAEKNDWHSHEKVYREFGKGDTRYGDRGGNKEEEKDKDEE